MLERLGEQGELADALEGQAAIRNLLEKEVGEKKPEKGSLKKGA